MQLAFCLVGYELSFCLGLILDVDEKDVIPLYFLKQIKDTLFAQSKSEYLSIQIYFKDFNKASFIELKFRNYGLLIFRMPILSIVCKRITVLTDVTKNNYNCHYIYRDPLI